MIDSKKHDTHILDASCRVALAAYLHDLGKFAERARLPVDNDRLDAHLTLYCPYHEREGRSWHSHKHAAYTAYAWELIERCFPELIGPDVSPFAAWNSPDVDDSVVNAAARHHKPDTFLQWIVATADRVASGFERETFETYNAGEDRTREGRNHYTTRQLTLFEQIRLADDGSKASRRELTFRYPLLPLSVKALFPVQAKECEGADDEPAQREYKKLWDQFVAALEGIPRSHRTSWPLWLDHFDSAWACYTHAIPAATAFKVRPEVSLYDHARTTAAIGTALWRYHHDSGDDTEDVRKRLADFARPDWNEQKLLLVQGDFFGIQDFIFATGGETRKRAAKLLRGRSFYISLLTECAALKILDALKLPPTSQVINTAGKFLIVSPHTTEAIELLERVQSEINDWFLEHTYGQSGIGLAWLPAACNDFLGARQGQEPPFRLLMKRLFEQLQEAKSRRFNLSGADAPRPLFDGFLDGFETERGVCEIDGRSPATQCVDDIHMCALAADQIQVGGHVAHRERMLITTKSLKHHTLHLPLFGYYVQFTSGQEETGKFGPTAREGVLRRAWDFNLPETQEVPLFQGYARRFLNGYVPLFGNQNEWDRGRYESLPAELREAWESDAPKTLEHLACDDREPDSSGGYRGVEALMTLKGDVDNLGTIFQKGLEKPTFAKMATLSRQMNAFFAVWLPFHCKASRNSTYTVFAGGDDFFVIGPWRSTIQLACEMRSKFTDYVAENEEITFSAGIGDDEAGSAHSANGCSGRRGPRQLKGPRQRRRPRVKGRGDLLRVHRLLAKAERAIRRATRNR